MYIIRRFDMYFERTVKYYMDKNTKTKIIRGAVVTAIFLIVFNFIVFLLPAERNDVFWICYIFGTAAILLQMLFVWTAFKDGKSKRSSIYGLPIINIGITYGVLQLVFSFIGILLSRFLPFWVPMLLFIILLGGAVIGTIAAKTVKEQIEYFDEKIVKDTMNIRSMQTKMDTLLERAQYDLAVKKEVSKLYDVIRYSDPVSSSYTANIESAIAGQLDLLQNAIQTKDNQSVTQLCTSISDMVKERNNICAEYKYKNN